MVRQRTQIQKRLEAALLFENDHTCCICTERGKHVQIHHIDGDNSNNMSGNLAVLCLDCHSRVTGASGLGKKYSEFEVKKYKKHWEYVVRKKRKLVTRFDTAQPFKRREKEAFRFEIKKNVYMLVAAQNLSRVKEILEFLDTYSTLEGDASYIFRQLIDVAPYLGYADLVATYVPQYLELHGPRDEDVREMKLAIELLRWIAEIGAMGMGFGQIQASLRALHEISETAKTYKLRALTSLIVFNLENLQMLLREDAEFLPATERRKAIKLTGLYLAGLTKPIRDQRRK